MTDNQGYQIDIQADQIKVKASSEVGAVYALTTLTQMLDSQQPLPLGTITDAPKVKERTVQVDNGRKYYSKRWFLNLIDEMAAAKSNSLILHFSEKTGFGIESTTLPDIMSTQYLTKDEVREIIDYANKNYITVTPELDMPGHLGQVLTNRPEYQLVNERPQNCRRAVYINTNTPNSGK